MLESMEIMPKDSMDTTSYAVKNQQKRVPFTGSAACAVRGGRVVLQQGKTPTPAQPSASLGEEKVGASAHERTLMIVG